MTIAAVLAVLTVCSCATVAAGSRWGGDVLRREVTYDSRALVLNGARRIMFSGEMHYTRSTPEVTCSSHCFAAISQVHPLDLIAA